MSYAIAYHLAVEDNQDYNLWLCRVGSKALQLFLYSKGGFVSVITSVILTHVNFVYPFLFGASVCVPPASGGPYLLEVHSLQFSTRRWQRMANYQAPPPLNFVQVTSDLLPIRHIQASAHYKPRTSPLNEF